MSPPHHCRELRDERQLGADAANLARGMIEIR
jgi:hypothetical protein